jgi:amidase
MAQVLTDLGHDVRELDTRWPDPTLAFLPQFVAGVRAEADEVEHYERLERRTRQLLRLGSWVRRPILDRALTAAALSRLPCGRCR